MPVISGNGAASPAAGRAAIPASGPLVRPLQDFLIERGYITAEEWRQAGEIRGVSPEQVLVDRGRLTPAQIAECKAARWGLPFRRLDAPPDASLDALLPPEVRKTGLAAVLESTRDHMTAAIADPDRATLRDQLRKAAFPRALELVVVPQEDIPAPADEAAELRELAGPDERERVDLADIVAAPLIVRLLERIVTRAIAEGASDIHIAKFGGRAEARFRVDGQMKRGVSFDPRALAGLISRLKLLARRDIAEHRVPQSGEFPWPSAEHRQYDLRLETSPDSRGEHAVVRIFGHVSQTTLEDLGFTPGIQCGLERLSHLPYGLLLLAGPTGCGKSTTLATVIRRIQQLRPGAIVYSIEDPVEQDIPGVVQIPVADRVGRTFAVGLRSLLRSNPDVVMIGEIRDGETALVATQAALTGHLVLGTLHTNTAPGAVPRLINLGVPAFQVADTLRAVLAQRLVRTVCRVCGTSRPFSEEARRQIPELPPFEMRGEGCSACYGGFRGRIGLGELLVLTPEIARKITECTTAREIRDLASLPTLMANGLEQIAAGRTTLSEVVAAAWSPEEGDPNVHLMDFPGLPMAADAPAFARF